jgi:adenylate cyclase
MMKRINAEKTLESAIHRTIESATVLLNCDRATMFIVDEIRDELVVRDASGSTVDIRIPMTAGIAGNVYSSGEVLNIPDAYSDSRFNKQVDVDTGYKTTSMLTTPVYDAEGNTLAVLQAINKKKDDGTHVAFGSEDETLIDYMAGQLGVILLNAKIYDDSVKAKAKVDSMLDIIRSIHGDLGVSSLCFILTERVPALVEADRCTLYLVDDKHSELWTLAGGVQIRMPKGTGIAGIAATEGEIVNIPDAYKDERFGGAEFDKKNNYHTKSILCLPIKEADGKVVAVLQLINKASGPFTDADQDLLGAFNREAPEGPRGALGAASANPTPPPPPLFFSFGRGLPRRRRRHHRELAAVRDELGQGAEGHGVRGPRPERGARGEEVPGDERVRGGRGGGGGGRVRGGGGAG